MASVTSVPQDLVSYLSYSVPDLPKTPTYLLSRGQPAPRLPSLLRPPIAMNKSTEILICFPSTTHFCLALGADLPYPDQHGIGTLDLSAWEFFTPIIVTHVSIRTSDMSSMLLNTPSTTYRTLPYPAHKCAAAASVSCLAPLHLPRRPTRLVSYYAFFKGWLLLSQPPSCLSLPTSFPT